MSAKHPKTRAVRKHHDKRIFLKRLHQCRTNFCRWSVGWEELSLETLRLRARKMASTPHPCSCMMCGNPRRWAGNEVNARTFQEIRSRHDFHDQLSDI